MTSEHVGNAALSKKPGVNPENAADDEHSSTETPPTLSTDDLFHLLQNQRRRRVIKYLREHDEGEGVDMRDVVEWVAAREHDTTVQALRSKERQRVYIALYQSHLPKLADAGVIEYDQRKGWVRRTELTPQIERFVVEADDETETTSSRTVRADSAATGVGALLILAGYSGFVPVISDFFVSLALFALMTVMALARVYDRL